MKKKLPECLRSNMKVLLLLYQLIKNKNDERWNDNKVMLQMVKGNEEFCRVIATADEWSEVEEVINRVCSVTKEQMDFIKQKQWD